MAGAPLGDRADAWRPSSRAGGERVLRELSDALGRGVRTCVLEGPLGIGKTQLLRALEARERPRRPVLFSPFLHFPPGEAVAWLCRLAEAPLPADDPATFAEALRGRPHAPALLLVDEAQAAPPATVARLGRLVSEGEGSVQLVWAGIEGPALARATAMLPGRPLRLRLDAPVTAEQTRALLALAADEPGLGEEARAALRACDAESLAEELEGIPRLVQNAIVERAFAAEARAWRARAASEAAAEEPEPSPARPGPEAACEAGEAPEPSLPRAAPPASLRLPTRAGGGRRAGAWLRAAGTSARAAAVRDAATVVTRACRALRDGGALAARAGGAAGALARRARIVLEERARTASGGLQRGSRRVRDGLPRITGAAAEAARRGERRILRRLERLASATARTTRRGALRGRRALERGGALARVTARALAARAARSLDGMGSRAAAARAALAPGARALVLRLGELRMGARRLVPGGVLLALLAAGLGWALLRGPEPGPEAPPPVSAQPIEAEAPGVRAAPPGGAPPRSPRAAKEASPPPAEPAAEGAPVTVHMNATPWARIRLDGRDLGVTPLTVESVRPGPHEIEAAFPDGRVERRIVEIGPDSRSVVFR